MFSFGERFGRCFWIETERDERGAWVTVVTEWYCNEDGDDYDIVIDRAVTRCADLVFDQHENMVARYI